MVFAVSLGGVSATSLFPTTVQTDHYSAAVRLSAIPSFTSTIHSPTSFGDLDLEFSSPFPAPGVDATVQVRDTITELFDDRRVSIDSIQPSSQEISDALSSGVTELGLKFSGGVLVVGVGAIAVIAYARRRRPTPRQFVSTGLAGLLSIAITGAGILGTYQPGQLSSFRTTGLLGTVRSNAGLLAGVEARAEQVTPYVRNLLALSAALQEKFIPEEVNQPQAARFLMVSDIHGANQYPVMKRIIDDEQITAVIDMGDLINFGRVTEAEVSGIFSAIGRLGVPYVFVRGNHDASSAADQGLLQRMARIPNVVLLEPSPQSYTEVKVNGVVIAGFNDPRYFGDDNKNNNQKQQPAADGFNRAYADRPRPDIVVTHEPGAARMVESATLRVNGHMHKNEIEGNRVTVGTFTGGGVVSHFFDKEGSDKRGENKQGVDKQGVDKQGPAPPVGVPAGDSGDSGDSGGEPASGLTGQPYAFSIAVFSQTCDLASVTSYTYRNLIQGRPAFDDVRVVSGKTISTREPGVRTCAASLGTVRTTVTLGG